jgi:anti-sigma regulatory factor (Ser/Thr protein kinase)
VPSGRSVVLRLQPTAAAPASARKAVEETCASLDDPALSADAMLLTSELVTNAVMHGTGIVTVAVQCDDEGVAVAVGDQARDRPHPRPLDADATSGRGLQIVSRMCASWGVRDGGNGDVAKFVWFSLPRRTHTVV